jgi:predicted O-linked N-acetylglucosamine transferase (SPINDLY family)
VLYVIGCGYHDAGEPEKATALLRAHLADRPDPELHNLLLKCMMASTATTKAEFRVESLLWSRLHADTSRAAADAAFRHLGLEPDKRLTVGILCGYAWSTLFEAVFTPLFAGIDRAQFRMVLFNMGAFASGKLRAAFDACIDLPDPRPRYLGAAVRDQRIDILLDLNGRFRLDNPVEVLIERVAPVQVSYGNMLATYGLGTINYLLTDRYIVPESEEPLYTERICRFDTGVSGTFELPDDPVAPLPCARTRPVSTENPFTFGSFNAVFKTNDRVLDTWGRILARVPGSRLLLKAGGIEAPRVRARIAAMVSRHGLSDRVFVSGMTPMEDMLRQYHLVDLALNTFPYSGGTTSAYALWYGVPSVTLDEASLLQCGGGAAMLREVGLDEFIVGSVDEYVERAVYHANHLDELAEVRATMRQRLSRSARFVPPLFAADFGRALRWIWRDWLAHAEL